MLTSFVSVVLNTDRAAEKSVIYDTRENRFIERKGQKFNANRVSKIFGLNDRRNVLVFL